MADLSQFIQALYPDRGDPNEPKLMTPESANRPTGRSQQEVDDAFPLLLRVMAAAQQHMPPPMGSSPSPVLRGMRRPREPLQPGDGQWEILRKMPGRQGVNSAPPYPTRALSPPAPTIAENDPFRALVAAKLAAQGGENNRVRGPAELAPAEKADFVEFVGGRYPHQDDPNEAGVGSTKFLTIPETELQKRIWSPYQEHHASPAATQYPKWSFSGDELTNRANGMMKERVGRDATKSDQALGEGWTVPHAVRPGAPVAAGSEINKDLLWGPAPTYQGTQWKGTKEDLAKFIEQRKRLRGQPPTSPNSTD